MQTTGLPVSPRFEETHWSLIVKAGRDDESGTAALNQFCRLYRMPLYGFVRHRGFSPADTEDILQNFFLDFIQREALHRVDQSKGRFRTFLLKSLKNFLANEWDRQHALKRGGGCTFASLDDPQAELLYGEFIKSTVTPEKLFDRVWALRVLNRALEELRVEYEAEGRLTTFQVLEPVLSMDGRAAPYADMARQLAMTESAVRMATSRMRRRYGQLLRSQIMKTVGDPAEVEDELRYLFSCL